MAALPIQIDRASPVPLYHQLAEQLTAAISNGTLRPGDPFENELALADRLGLSRPTVRRAIAELVGQGLLVRRRGIGTQVVHGPVKRPMDLTSLFDDLTRSDQKPATQVLDRELVSAPAAVAERLGVATGTQVLHLRRLRTARGDPLAVMRNWLPADLAPVLTAEALTRRGLYELMRGTGVHLRIATQRIGARRATAAEARLLAVRKGAPLLTMERVSYDGSGRAVELGSHVYDAEAYSVEMTVVER
jgi:DNA-binding GntR family transcriptional regulator